MQNNIKHITFHLLKEIAVLRLADDLLNLFSKTYIILTLF